ncbi:MAG TPA: hypothetical protein VF203_04865 [Burkholderiales bacterium]
MRSVTRYVRAGVALAALAAAAAGAQPDASGDSELGIPYLIPPAVVPLDIRQREEIVKIRRELHERECTLTGELLQAQEELRAEMSREPRREEGIAEAARRVQEVEARIRAARAEAVRDATRLLTPDQRSAFARWQEGVRRAGGEAEPRYSVQPGVQPDAPDVDGPDAPERRPR